MLSTLMIISLNQGNLAGAPRSIGAFDERLLADIGYDERIVCHRSATPQWSPVVALVGIVRSLAVSLLDKMRRIDRAHNLRASIPVSK